jgi:hypothetical protein
MGVPAAWEINDVYGLEPELLSMLPQPVLAISHSATLINILLCSDELVPAEDGRACRLGDQ